MMSDFNEIMKVPLFLHVLMSPMVVCTSGLILIISSNVETISKSLFNMLGTSIQLFMFCYFGDDINEYVRLTIVCKVS